MADFDAKYVKDHIATIHTPDSWARSISEQALNEAIKQMKGGKAPSVTVPATFHITAVEAKGCIQVCGEIGGVVVCTHINI